MSRICGDRGRPHLPGPCFVAAPHVDRGRGGRGGSCQDHDLPALPRQGELATAAIADLLPVAVPEPTGNAYEDLLAQLDFNRRGIDMALPGALLAEERRRAQLLESFREGVLRPRARILRGILETGVERGEIRPDVDFDAACDLVIGCFLFRYLVEGRPDEEWPRRVLDTLWPALRAS